MELVAHDKLNEILAQDREGITRDRMNQLIDHIRKVRPEMRAETHKVLSENLQGAELAFYKEIIVPDEPPASAPVVAKPNPPAPSPEAAVIEETETAAAAKSEAARNRSR